MSPDVIHILVVMIKIQQDPRIIINQNIIPLGRTRLSFSLKNNLTTLFDIHNKCCCSYCRTSNPYNSSSISYRTYYGKSCMSTYFLLDEINNWELKESYFYKKIKFWVYLFWTAKIITTSNYSIKEWEIKPDRWGEPRKPNINCAAFPHPTKARRSAQHAQRLLVFLNIKIIIFKFKNY